MFRNFKKQINTNGFTHTPTLALLQCVFNQVYKIYLNIEKKLHLFFSLQRNKKTMSKLVSGFTLVEMIIYVTLMTLITIISTQSLVVVLKSNRSSFVENNIRNSGYGAMEGMLREIRLSENIDQVLGGILQMKQNSGTNTVKFATSSNDSLNFYEGTSTPILIGPLTSKGVTVKNLIFTQMNTGKSVAVRIEMKLESSVNGLTKSEWFYGTAILRGSY